VSHTVSRSPLSICTFLRSEALERSVLQFLSVDRYQVIPIAAELEFFRLLSQSKQQIDCLILQEVPELPQIVHQLSQLRTLLPMVVLSRSPASTLARHPTGGTAPLGATDDLSETPGLYDSYYRTAIRVSVAELEQIPDAIELAIAEFLKLSALGVDLSDSKYSLDALTTQSLLTVQQQSQTCLAQKLKERLGYLGVYYKRDPKNFFRYLPPAQKQELLGNLKADYREIILSYFDNDNSLNQTIDEFVNLGFLTDVSVSQIVEIHMDLMDEFSKQLQMENRSEDILLDYRLTLIDIIAHLCEMYRRSIPRES